VNAKGVAGDWQPLANLVRLPMLKKLDCPATPELACKLTGSSLYLIDSISADAQFTKPAIVPDGFLGSAMPVPHPRTGTLYVKLRDNPQIANPTALTVQAIPPAPAETDRTEVRQSALTTDTAGPPPGSSTPSSVSPPSGSSPPSGTSPTGSSSSGVAPSSTDPPHSTKEPHGGSGDPRTTGDQ
jgi:hypothetical protein